MVFNECMVNIQSIDRVGWDDMFRNILFYLTSLVNLILNTHDFDILHVLITLTYCWAKLPKLPNCCLL